MFSVPGPGNKCKQSTHGLHPHGARGAGKPAPHTQPRRSTSDYKLWLALWEELWCGMRSCGGWGRGWKAPSRKQWSGQGRFPGGRTTIYKIYLIGGNCKGGQHSWSGEGKTKHDKRWDYRGKRDRITPSGPSGHPENDARFSSMCNGVIGTGHLEEAEIWEI